MYFTCENLHDSYRNIYENFIIYLLTNSRLWKTDPTLESSKIFKKKSLYYKSDHFTNFLGGWIQLRPKRRAFWHQPRHSFQRRSGLQGMFHPHYIFFISMMKHSFQSIEPSDIHTAPDSRRSEKLLASPSSIGRSLPRTMCPNSGYPRRWSCVQRTKCFVGTIAGRSHAGGDLCKARIPGRPRSVYDKGSRKGLRLFQQRQFMDRFYVRPIPSTEHNNAKNGQRCGGWMLFRLLFSRCPSVEGWIFRWRTGR